MNTKKLLKVACSDYTNMCSRGPEGVGTADFCNAVFCNDCVCYSVDNCESKESFILCIAQAAALRLAKLCASTISLKKG